MSVVRQYYFRFARARAQCVPRVECSWAGKFGGLEGPRDVLSICTLPGTRPCTESGTHRGGWGGSRKSRCAPRGRESCRKSSQKHLFSTLPWAPRFRGTVPNPNNKLCSLRPHTGFIRGRQGSRGRQPPGGGAGAEPPQENFRIRNPFPGRKPPGISPPRVKRNGTDGTDGAHRTAQSKTERNGSHGFPRIPTDSIEFRGISLGSKEFPGIP